MKYFHLKKIIYRNVAKLGGTHIRSLLSRGIKQIGIGFIAAMGTGIILGILLRLIMKIVAVVYPNLSTGFTFQGTLLLIIIGIGSALAFSTLFIFCRKYLPRNWFIGGFLYGLIILCIFSYPFFTEENGELNGPQKPLGIFLFSFLFIIGGIILSKFVMIAEKWIEKEIAHIKYCYIAFYILIVPCLFFVFALLKELIEGYFLR